MELGAVVCLPNGVPQCERCPVRELCAAHLEERTAELPVKAAKKRRIEERRVWLIFRNGRVALRRGTRQGTGWQGCGSIQMSLRTIRLAGALAHFCRFPENAGAGKHIFTPSRWYDGEAVCAGADNLPEDGSGPVHGNWSRCTPYPMHFRVFGRP